MSRNNQVFQVLVTKGNQAPIAANNTVADLAPGQIGVFDFDTNLSIDGTGANRNFYIAVGLDTDNDGTTDDVAKSRGTHIQSRNTAYYTFRPHTPGRPLKVVLKDYIAKENTEYGIKLELRNQEIYRTQGYNQFTKTYSVVTSTEDANEITKALKININNDASGLVTAKAIARQALTAVTHGVAADLASGAEVSDADLEALITYNEGQTLANYVYTDLEVETVTQKVNAFCDVNLKYFYPRETIAIMSKSTGAFAGFNTTGTIEVTQQAVFAEGAGYDIKQREYEAKGYDESPYRVSTINGVADYKVYNTDSTVNYDQIVVSYDQVQKNAWLQYQNPEATYIAIPAADAATRTGLVPILDGLLTPQGFDAKDDDSDAAVANESTVEQTEDKGAATDGIG